MDTDLMTTSAEYEAAQERFMRIQNRAGRNFGYGSSEEGMAIAATCLERLSKTLEERLEQPITEKGWTEKANHLLRLIAPDIIALAAVRNALKGAMDDLPLVVIYTNTGRLLNEELFAHGLRLHDAELQKRVEKWVKEKHGNQKFRAQSARSIAKKMGFSFVNKWTQTQIGVIPWCRTYCWIPCQTSSRSRARATSAATW